MADDNIRYDFGMLAGKAKRTEQGFFRLRGSLTRVGVLVYKRKDGEVIRELRVPEEVFADESLETLNGAPVTNLHPAEFVNADNSKDLMAGVISEGTVKPDGHLISGNLLITDSSLIGAIDTGKRKEISPGYKVNLEMGEGEWNGERYDAVQRLIRYNHVALGPSGWGRSGPEVSLRLDSDAYQLTDEEFENRPLIVGVSADLAKKRKKKMETIKIDGVEYEVPKSAAQAFRQREDSLSAELAETKKANDETQAQLDEAKANLDSAKAELEAAKVEYSAEAIASAVKERVELLDTARKLAPDAKFDDAKDLNEIRLITLTERGVEGLEDKSIDYISARFDASIEHYNQAKAKAKEAVEVFEKARNTEVEPVKHVDEISAAQAAYNEFLKSQA